MKQRHVPTDLAPGNLRKGGPKKKPKGKIDKEKQIKPEGER